MPSQTNVPDMDEEEREPIQGNEEEPIQGESSQEEQGGRPSLVINIHSWATPIVALLMLAIGLLGGYFGRPLISPQSESENLTAALPQDQGETTVQSPAAPQPTVDDASRQEVMDFMVSQTRHFKGDPDAPVTIIEFSDFQ